MGSRNRRWTQIPSCRRETPVRHRPGRPRYHFARHAPRRTSTRPGATEFPPVRDCGQYPPRPYHRQMSPSRVRSQPSPRSAHGFWMRHVRRHDALVDRLPFMMPDTSSRPVGCSGLAFRELISADPDCSCLLDMDRSHQGRRNFMTAPRPGDAFHLDLDGTVIAGRYIEVDPPHRMVIGWDRRRDRQSDADTCIH